MSASIESLDPRQVWQIFCEIAAVPRPSKKERRIRDHVKEFAAAKGLAFREEAAPGPHLEVGNLIIEVPASRGCEKAPITVLQAHLDMVCEKNRDVRHDFDREGIKLRIGADTRTGKQIVYGEGTTLGADNGMGVAMALAAATDPSVRHGPLEILLTIDEEAGMSGAKALTPASFKGRRLLNLDSEEDDAIYIGCAGGCDTNLAWDCRRRALGGSMEVCRVSVHGLRGGHSGSDIHENRANAIKLLARVLISAPAGLRLAEISGGSKRNAIPREAHAVVAGAGGTVAALQTAAARVAAEARAESYEESVALAAEPADPAGLLALDASESNDILSALIAIPSGVIGMHPRVAGLVQTSNNLSTIESAADGEKLRVSVGCLSRSSSMSLLMLTARQIAEIGRLSGAHIDHANRYPGWEPNVDSPTLAACKRVYEKLFGRPPKVMAIHAGLECGIIGERVGGGSPGDRMDMVSFGPNITGAHSPDERVYVDSVARSWKYLVAVLDELANG